MDSKYDSEATVSDIENEYIINNHKQLMTVINKGYRKTTPASQIQYFKQVVSKHLNRHKQIVFIALVHYHIGFIYEKDKNLNKAIKYYKRSLRGNPKSPQTIRHIVNCMQQQNNDKLWMEDEWVQMLKKAWEYGLAMKWNRECLFETIECCLKLGHFKIEYYSQYNKESLLWFKRGCELLVDVECIKTFTIRDDVKWRVNKLNNKYEMNITRTALLQYQMNLVDKLCNLKYGKVKIVEELSKIFECNYDYSARANEADFTFDICSSYAKFQWIVRSDLERAEKWYLKALQICEKDSSTHWSLAEILWKSGRFDDAMRHYQLNLQYCSESESAAAKSKMNMRHNQLQTKEREKDVFDEMNVSEEIKQQMRSKTHSIMTQYNQIFGCESDQVSKLKFQIRSMLQQTVSEKEIVYMMDFCQENEEDLEANLKIHGIHFLEMIQAQMRQIAQNELQINVIEDTDEDYVPIHNNERQHRRKKKRVCTTTTLDEWLKSLSHAQRKAFKCRKQNENEFYYRFNSSNIESDDDRQYELILSEPSKKGKWTSIEHKAFMQRVLQCGVNVKWGMFAKVIYGRVGYVCSNYWRTLIKKGSVIDLNYVKSSIDPNKFIFISNKSDAFKRFAVTIINDESGTFKKLPVKHPRHPSNMKENRKRSIVNTDVHIKNPKKKRKRKNKNCISSDDNDQFNDNSKGFVTVPDNPIPTFIDIMTGKPVIKPAICPYGFVLGYVSWTTILRNEKCKNECPFTKKRLTRRSLVKLTKSNFEKHRDNIRNFTNEDKKSIAIEDDEDDIRNTEQNKPIL